MRYCGIDASSSCTGLCFFDDKELIYYNKFRPRISIKGTGMTKEEKKASPYDDDMQLKYNAMDIASQVIEVIDKYKPDIIYMEAAPEMVRKGSQNGNILRPLYALGVVHGAYVYYFSSIIDHTIIHFVKVHAWRSKLGFLKVAVDKRGRDEQKAMAVDFVNKQFGLDLSYVKGTNRIANDDDIAEAICIVWAMIKDN